MARRRNRLTTDNERLSETIDRAKRIIADASGASVANIRIVIRH
jgi:hypothetical protein